jgi:hypothetical protein
MDMMFTLQLKANFTAFIPGRVFKNWSVRSLIKLQRSKHLFLFQNSREPVVVRNLQQQPESAGEWIPAVFFNIIN